MKSEKASPTEGIEEDVDSGATADSAPAAESCRRFDYMLLNRLQVDCEYYLGNGCRANKHLWAGAPAAQIKKMRELHHGLREKPHWLTIEQIDSYEAAMLSTSVGSAP